MLSESLEDPNFRQECEDANVELAELDKTIAARGSVDLMQTDVAAQCCDNKKPTKNIIKNPTAAC